MYKFEYKNIFMFQKSSNAINETQLLSSNTRILVDNLTYLDKKKIKTLSVLSDAIEVNDQLNKRIEVIQSSTDRVVEQSQNLLNNIVNSEYDLDQIEHMGSSKKTKNFYFLLTQLNFLFNKRFDWN